MHQLAIALRAKGNLVTGSDDEINEPARGNLSRAGLLPESEGWDPSKINKDLDAVVLGMHAKANNPELLEAQKLGIPIYSFPQYVYEVCKDKTRVVVAGSHGKTTITSMIMHVLRACGKDFDYLVGAKVAGFDESVRLSNAPLIVLEGDEYPASAVEPKPKIFFYHPHISVLSGIAWDHINVFPTAEIYVDQFAQYLKGLEPGTKVWFNREDSEVVDVVSHNGEQLETHPYGQPAFHYEDNRAVLDTPQGPVQVSVFGWHNLLNMEAARGVCGALGVSDADFYKAIMDFGGAARRLERFLERPGLIVFRDFAHAPSKLKASLSAVREALPKHKLVAVFELHTYSSLNADFLAQYKDSMDDADVSMVFYSGHALELKGLPPLSESAVREAFGRDDLIVATDAEALKNGVSQKIADLTAPVCLLLMSSGTFDGLDWASTLNY
jgi:UDP-N-acetylmuramate: L-alanyl-gamma-D-glutamyl-meso-diaminopimelate ligase